MSKLLWNQPGERFFETGVDRGVLYVDGKGLAWNGLASVEEKSSGGESIPYYVDGIKFAQSTPSDDYVGTIQAFSRPEEFAPCEGRVDVVPGLEATGQGHKPFGLSYRSLVGNDVDGTDHGYRIHLLYNVYASTPDRTASTTTTTPDPERISWDVMALPVVAPGLRPTAHFVLDSRTAPPDTLLVLEEKLYGSDSNEPYLPELSEIMGILTANSNFVVVDNGDGTFSITGPDAWFEMVDPTTWQLTADSITLVDATTYTITST